MTDSIIDTDDRLRSVTGFRAMALMAVMLSGTPLVAIIFSTIAPILPAIAAHFGPSGGVMLAQWTMTMPAIGLMLGGPSGGYLIDRIGVRRLTILSIALFAFAGSAGLYVDDPRLLLISRFVLGWSGTCAATSATWLIGQRYDEMARRRVIGAQNALSGAAAMGAVLLSGWGAAAAGWRAPFAIFLIALPLLLCAMVGIPLLSGMRSGKRQNMESSGETRALLRLWPHYLVIAATAGLMLMPATQVPFVLQSNGVDDPVTRSQVIACSSMLSILTAALFPLIRGRVGERGTMLLILGFYAIGTATLAASHDALVTALGCLLMGSATGLFTPHFTSIIIRRSAPALRGRALGAMFGAIFLSEFISPLIVLPLRRQFGVHGGFVPLAAMLAFAFVVMLTRSHTAKATPELAA